MVVILGDQGTETSEAVAAKRANRKREEASERMARSVGERSPEGETPWAGPAWNKAGRQRAEEGLESVRNAEKAP